MVRVAGIVVCLIGMVAWVGSALAEPEGAALRLDDAERCPTIEAGQPIPFEGRTLVETPDLPPELRLVNALVTGNCVKRAEQVENEFLAAHPNDFRVSFINARVAWMVGDAPKAKVIGDLILRQHPDFSSMLVLMASLAVFEKDYERAQKMLDRIDALQPNDLWAFVDHLCVEAELIPTRQTFERARALILDSNFPAGARQNVYNAARYMQGLTDGDRDELFASMMGKKDTAKDCILEKQALEAIEIRHDPEKGARIIEENLRTSGACVATPVVRALLAEAYLLEAAKIAPRPTARNAKLVREAKEAMGGDLTALARRAAARPGLLDPIIPFLKGSVQSRGPESDELGEPSAICMAIASFNPVMVKEELKNGANPNGKCSDFDLTLVRRLLFMAANDHVPERQAILRLLLEHGARVEGLDFCSKRESGDCSQTLAPILQEFENKRAASRATL
jgi:hypothetical protein